MRVLTVVADLGLRGTQRAAEAMALGLAARGHEVAVLAHSGPGPRLRHLVDAGIVVHRGWEDLDSGLDAALASAPEIVHIHRAGMSNQRESAILRKIREHSHHVAVIETNVFGRVDYSPAAELIDVHLHISRYGLWRWRRWMGRVGTGKPAACVPYPADGERFFPSSDGERMATRNVLGIKNDAFVCGHVGYKLSHWVLSSFERLAASDPQAHLVCVPLPEDLRARVEAMPSSVRSRVHARPVYSSDDELRRLYGSLDCFLHAAVIGESFGLVLAEAMLCGVPVVTASRPHRDNAQLEVVGHGEGGIVVASTDHLGDGLEMLRSDTGLRRRLGMAGRRRIEERYAPARVNAALERVARHAVRCRSRCELIEALASDDEVVTQVPTAEIRGRLSQAVGRASWRDLLVRNVVLQPIGQRLISLARHRFQPWLLRQLRFTG